MSANNMDLGHTQNHKSQWSAAIPAQAPAPLPQSNQVHPSCLCPQFDSSIPLLQPMPNTTPPPSSQCQVSHSVTYPHATPNTRGGCNNSSPLSPLIEIHDEATSEPDGWNSPNQSEKLSSELEWENCVQRSHVPPINKGKSKVIPQFPPSDNTQMSEPNDCPPHGDDGRDGFDGMGLENTQDEEHLDQDLYNNPPPECQEQCPYLNLSNHPTSKPALRLFDLTFSNLTSNSHSQQTTIYPLQALQSQQQVVTSSDQQPWRQAPSHVQDQGPSTQIQVSATQPIADQLPPSPPPSHFNSLCNAEDEEIPYCVGNERVGVNYDVLKCHHTTHCHPQSPSPTSLMSTLSGQTHQPPTRCSNAPMQFDDESLVDLQSDAEGQPRHHGRYYLLLWRKLLDLAKAQMQLHIAVENAFPWLEEAVDGICCEVLIEVITHFEDKGWEVEAIIQLTGQLFNDTQTFCSNVKKTIMKTLLFDYELYPLSSAGNDEAWIKFVKDKADKLLRTSVYLHGKPDALGKSSNFTHPAIKNACLSLYYSSTASKSLCQFVKFQNYVLYKALMLVVAVISHCIPWLQCLAVMPQQIHTVLSTLCKHGSEVTSNLITEDVECAYRGLEGQVDHILGNPYHSPKLDSMLEEWAASGMTGYTTKTGGITKTSHNEFNVVLD
ncbi:hypothetical protein J3A83DRAFT_4368638 [Scleroderma citrinum]